VKIKACFLQSSLKDDIKNLRVARPYDCIRQVDLCLLIVIAVICLILISEGY